MFKWVLGLCLALYAVLILFGGEGYDPDKYAVAEPEKVTEDVEETRATAIIQEPSVEPAVTETTATETSGDLIVPVQSTELEQKIEVIAPNAESLNEETRPTLVLQAATSAPASGTLIEPEVEQVAVLDIEASEPETTDAPVGEIWTVTGNRVNLRSGASTSNGVVGQAVRGDSAEIVEMLDNGWAKVYIIDTGVEAYMSAEFLSPEQG